MSSLSILTICGATLTLFCADVFSSSDDDPAVKTQHHTITDYDQLESEESDRRDDVLKEYKEELESHEHEDLFVVNHLAATGRARVNERRQEFARSRVQKQRQTQMPCGEGAMRAEAEMIDKSTQTEPKVEAKCPHSNGNCAERPHVESRQYVNVGCQAKVDNEIIKINNAGTAKEENEEKVFNEKVAISVAIYCSVLVFLTYFGLMAHAIYKAVYYGDGGSEVNIFSEEFIEKQKKKFEIEERCRITMEILKKIQYDNRENPLTFPEVIRTLKAKLIEANVLKDKSE